MTINHLSFFRYLLLLLFILILILFGTRFYFTFSTLHSLTGGIEDEGLLAIWLTKNTEYFQNHYLNFSFYFEEDLKIFNLFQYNWLWYFLNSKLLEIYQYLFNLNDNWFANIIRINNFIFSIISSIFLYLTVSLKSKIKYLNILLVLLVLFGPLTGFWNISVKPDFGYLIFEIIAIFLFLKNIDKLNFFKIFIITIILYLAWSVKQTSIITSFAIFVYLIIKKDKLVFYYCLTFIALVSITFLIAGENYINNILWMNAETNFSFLHFFKLLVTSIGKFFPVFIIAIFYFINRAQNNFIDIKQNNYDLFCLIGFIASIFNILLSFHIGSAPNYYFVTSIYLLILSSSHFKNIISLKNVKSLELKIINVSLIIQSTLIVLLLFGFFGKTKPFYYKDVEKIKECLIQIEKPIFFGSSLEYYRLPWVNGQYEKNPLIKNWFYERKYSNMPIVKTPIYKLIKRGDFETLVLSHGDRDSYYLNKYYLYKICSAESKYYIYKKVKK